jgi:acyl-ACP thioesterase
VREQEVPEKLPVSPPVKLHSIDPFGHVALAVFVTVVVQVVGLPAGTLAGEQLTLTLVSACPSVNVICARDFDPDAVR